jgi:phage repressor protein C with HTH and peptisase S24 domain
MNIKELRERHGLTQEQLAEKTGIPRDRIAKWEQGKGSPKTEDHKTLETFFGKNKREVVPHGTNSKNREDFDELVLNESENASKNYIQERRAKKGVSVPYMVPLVPVKAQAGYAQAYPDTDLFTGSLEKYPILPGIDHRGAEWRYFEVEGDSMEPTLFERDYILVSMVPPDDWRDIKQNKPYVVLIRDEVYVKFIYTVDRETWILLSANKRIRQKKVLVSDVKELWVFRGRTTRILDIPKIEIKV